MTSSGAKSRRDRMVISIVVVVALYALAVLLWFMGRGLAWSNARKGYERALNTLKSQKALIAQRSKWEARAEEKLQRMPEVPEDEVPAVRWERIIERLAEQYHVSVGKGLKAQQVDKDKEEDENRDVWEMPVDVRFENTSLLRLVEFLYAINQEEEAMMDVRELDVSVRGKNVGALNGKLVLTCAYRKGEALQEEDSQKSGDKPKGKAK